MREYPDVMDEIVNAMARVLFVQAYAAQEEEAGRSIGGGQDWMDHAPATSAAAGYAAMKLAIEVEKRNMLGLNTLYGACAAYYPEQHRKKPTPEDFGHYLAMQALGHGVSWDDDHPDPGLQLPYIEFNLD
jgi:hypothetical protein